MKIVEMPVSKLKPYNRNNRKHPQTQIDKLAKQIAAHGWDVPIVVDKDNVIIKGHGRLKAAKQLGLKVVPVVVRDDLTPEQCNAARIADNKLSELAEIDMEALQLELDALKAIDFDLDLTAFDSWNPFAVEGEQPTEGLTDADDVPELKPDPKSKLGDVWLLGNHRVMCGDSTDAASVAILMNGHKSDMVFTDPPYNIDFKPQRGTHGKIENDNMSREDFMFWLDKVVSCFYNNSKDNSYSIVWSGWSTIDQFAPCLRKYLNIKAMPIWVKNNFGIGYYSRPKYEPFFLCLKGEPEKPTTAPSDVFECAKVHKTIHSCEKPTDLIENIFSFYAEKKALVLDLFLGSGSTLIACEKTGRKCYGMELSPQYVDVIIKRWQDFTGKKAVREDGTEFDAL